MEHWHRSGQALLNEISSTRLPASQLAVWSIGQCGFIFKYEDTVVCIDPVLSDLTGPSGSRRCYPAPFAPEALRATPAWRWGISLPSAALRSCIWATPT